MWERDSLSSTTSSETRVVLQVHCAPEEELNYFYQQSVALVAKDFHEQIDSFIEGAYSGSLVLTPDLGELGYHAQLILANSSHAQIQWLRQYGSREIDTDNWRDEVVRLQVEHYRPDIVLFSGLPTFDSNFVESLDPRPDMVACWILGSVSEEFDWGEFDVVLAGYPGIGDHAMESGASELHFLSPGFPLSVSQHLSETPPEQDLLFVGPWDPRFTLKRNFYLSQLASLADDSDNSLSANFILSGALRDIPEEVEALRSPPKYGISLYQEIAASSFVFCAAQVSGVDDTAGKGRSNLSKGYLQDDMLFSATGCGSVLIAEDHENLHELYDDDEILFFQSLEELHERLLSYHENPAALSQIARKGAARCQKEHSTKSRAYELHGLIQEYLERKYGASENSALAWANSEERGASPSGFLQHAFAGPLGDSARFFYDITQAIDHLHAGRYSDAAVQFNSILSSPALSPGRVASLGRLLSLRELGRLEDVRDAVLEHLELYPDDSEARNLLEETVGLLEEKVDAAVPVEEDSHSTERLDHSNIADSPVHPKTSPSRKQRENSQPPTAGSSSAESHNGHSHIDEPPTNPGSFQINELIDSSLECLQAGDPLTGPHNAQ